METFGRYLLIRQIGSGGMAQVFHAKSFGEGGFAKDVALKKVLPNLGADKAFIEMLTDEARLAVELNHPNIVQTYDFGRVGSEYFIAMEYVSGVTLRALMERALERDKKLSVEVALFVASKIAQALQSAHSRTDSKGNPLWIVHRDVTPQNILLSFDGHVKLADFGIAKAATNVSHTQAGFLKGKIAYMAPEQARGEVVDGRADIFALGMVLFECLARRRFFSETDSLTILRKLQTAQLDLEQHLMEIPEAMRPILCRALAKEPRDRYSSAFEFYQSLITELRRLNPTYDSFSFADFKGLFLEESAREEEERQIEVSEEMRQSLIRGPSAGAGTPSSDATSYLGGSREFQSLPSVQGRMTRILKSMALPVVMAVLVVSLANDLLKPVLFLLPAVAGLSLVGAAIIVLVNWRHLPKGKRIYSLLERGAGRPFAFFSASFVAWAMLSALYMVLPERGIIGASIPAIGDLQNKLLEAVQGDVKEIKAGVQDIREDVKSIKEAVDRLSTQETIIRDANKPAELYHNARLYSLWGDSAKAIEQYQAFLEKTPYYVDVNESFLSLLKNTQGVEAARRIYKELSEKYPRDPTTLTMSLRVQELPAPEHIAKLKALASAYPHFGFAYAELARAAISGGFGALTGSEKHEFIEFVDKFKDMDREGFVKGFFIDKDALEKVYSEMDGFKRNYAAAETSIMQNPIDFSTEQTEEEVQLVFFVKDPGFREIQYNIDSPENLRSTGSNALIQNVQGDGPMPNITVLGKISIGKHVAYVRYRDRKDAWSPVFQEPFEVRPVAIEAIPSPSDLISDKGKISIRFKPYSSGDSKRPKGFEYSIDGPELDKYLANVRSGVELELKKGPHQIFVRASYGDGTKSEVYQFPFTVN